jgi:hypothetical protein
MPAFGGKADIAKLGRRIRQSSLCYETSVQGSKCPGVMSGGWLACKPVN